MQIKNTRKFFECFCSLISSFFIDSNCRKCFLEQEPPRAASFFINGVYEWEICFWESLNSFSPSVHLQTRRRSCWHVVDGRGVDLLLLEAYSDLCKENWPLAHPVKFGTWLIRESELISKELFFCVLASTPIIDRLLADIIEAWNLWQQSHLSKDTIVALISYLSTSRRVDMV